METAEKPKIESKTATVPVKTYADIRKKEIEALPDLMKEISQINRQKRLSRASMLSRRKRRKNIP